MEKLKGLTLEKVEELKKIGLVNYNFDVKTKSIGLIK